MPLLDHPQRVELNDEVHARPPEALPTPLRVSSLALFSPTVPLADERHHVAALITRAGAPAPAENATDFVADLGTFRLKWERHTEFTRFTFIATGLDVNNPFGTPALQLVPADWLQQLKGEILAAAHVGLMPVADTPPDYDAIGARLFNGNPLIGARIAGGAGIALTDLRIHQDGFSRMMVLNASMNQRQTGRMVQRVLEIDVYRMLALLALPVARTLNPFLSQCERGLAEVTAALARAKAADEGRLLDQLTRLQAEIESRHAESDSRFAAAAAYHELVRRRIGELREERIQGLQTFREFTERRLAPAMNTCQAAATRQESLSARMARATQLLSTRVDVDRQRQNQAVLQSMNRRAQLQLRLQETVEGLSIAAITYYVASLVGYLAKSMKAGGVPLNPDLVVGISIPVVALLVAFGVRSIRKRIARASPL
jgi:uncharacterized membrane-anchored protein